MQNRTHLSDKVIRDYLSVLGVREEMVDSVTFSVSGKLSVTFKIGLFTSLSDLQKKGVEQNGKN